MNHYQESGELCQEDVIGRPSEGVEAKEEQRRRRERRGEKGESLGYSKTEHAEDRKTQTHDAQVFEVVPYVSTVRLYSPPSE